MPGAFGLPCLSRRRVHASHALSDARHREEVLLGCPAFRVAQGNRVAGTDPGSPFLCLLSFGEAKESETPRKGGKQRLNNGIPTVGTNNNLKAPPSPNLLNFPLRCNAT